MKESIRDRLAAFIFDTRYEKLPEDIIYQAKRCILDFMGVALAGSRVGLAPLITKTICEMGGVEEATIIGDGRKIPFSNAALINGVRGHSLDMDDGHRYAGGHPAVAILPAALALAERENVSGKDLIEAVVAGYEVFIGIASGINPSHLLRGFHTTGTVGPFGAVAASSKILCLTRDEIKNALSIAGLMGAGLLEVMTSGQMVKALHPGRAAQAGLLASCLAQGGAEGPEKIFEGKKGFIKAFSDMDRMNEVYPDAGNGFEILNIYFKHHAACRHIHPALDAIREIMTQHEIDLDGIKRIDVDTYSVAVKLTGSGEEINTALGAKFSLPLSVALLLAYGNAGVDEYSVDSIKNPLIRRLAEKVKVRVDKARDEVYPHKRGASVRIESSEGIYRFELDHPKGEPENPLSDEDLKNKFLQNANKILTPEKAERMKDLVFHIEDKSVRELMRTTY